MQTSGLPVPDGFLQGVPAQTPATESRTADAVATGSGGRFARLLDDTVGSDPHSARPLQVHDHSVRGGAAASRARLAGHPGLTGESIDGHPRPSAADPDAFPVDALEVQTQAPDAASRRTRRAADTDLTEPDRVRTATDPASAISDTASGGTVAGTSTPAPPGAADRPTAALHSTGGPPSALHHVLAGDAPAPGARFAPEPVRTDDPGHRTGATAARTDGPHADTSPAGRGRRDPDGPRRLPDQAILRGMAAVPGPTFAAGDGVGTVPAPPGPEVAGFVVPVAVEQGPVVLQPAKQLPEAAGPGRGATPPDGGEGRPAADGRAGQAAGPRIAPSPALPAAAAFAGRSEGREPNPRARLVPDVPPAPGRLRVASLPSGTPPANPGPGTSPNAVDPVPVGSVTSDRSALAVPRAAEPGRADQAPGTVIANPTSGAQPAALPPPAEAGPALPASGVPSFRPPPEDTGSAPRASPPTTDTPSPGRITPAGPVQTGHDKAGLVSGAAVEHPARGRGGPPSGRADPDGRAAVPVRARQSATPLPGPAIASPGISAAPPEPGGGRREGVDLAVDGESRADTLDFGPAERPGRDDPVGAAHDPVRPRADLRPATAHQIVDAIRQGPGRVELTLSPEELGRVTLTIASQDGTMTVMVSAERPETLDLIRRHIDLLMQEARSAGFAGLEFGFGGDDRFPPGSLRRPDEGAEDAVSPRAPAPRPGTLAPDSPVALRGGLDLRL